MRRGPVYILQEAYSLSFLYHQAIYLRRLLKAQCLHLKNQRHFLTNITTEGGSEPDGTRNLEKLYIFLRIPEIGTLPDTEKFLFWQISNGYFEIMEKEIGNHTP